MTGSKRCASDEQVNARTTGQRKEGMRCVLGLRICGTAGAKGLGEVKARIERGVRFFVTCGCGVLVVLCKGQKTSGRQLGASKGGRSAAIMHGVERWILVSLGVIMC